MTPKSPTCVFSPHTVMLESEPPFSNRPTPVSSWCRHHSSDLLMPTWFSSDAETRYKCLNCQISALHKSQKEAEMKCYIYLSGHGKKKKQYCLNCGFKMQKIKWILTPFPHPIEMTDNLREICSRVKLKCVVCVCFYQGKNPLQIYPCYDEHVHF